MRIGFIGLGNVGGKLAGSILRNDFDLTVRDLDSELEHSFAQKGATIGESPAQIARNVDILITCLPNPEASANVMEGEDGVLSAIGPGTIWAEMSTTDEREVRRLGEQVMGAESQSIPQSPAGVTGQLRGTYLFLLGPSALLLTGHCPYSRLSVGKSSTRAPWALRRY